MIFFYCLLPQDLAWLVAFCVSPVKVYQNKKSFKELSDSEEMEHINNFALGVPLL